MDLDSWSKLTNTSSKYKTIQFFINTLRLAKVLKTFILYFLYSIKLFKAKIQLDNDSKIIILLNTSLKINIIMKNLIKNTNLALR